MRLPSQRPGEIRNGLVMYPGGDTWHFCVRWRGKKKMGDTKCSSLVAAKRWLDDEKKAWALEDHHEREKPTPTLREVWNAWAAVKCPPVVSKTHFRYMKGVVFQHAEPHLDLPITELTTEAMEQLRVRYLTTTGEGFKRGGGHTVRTHSEGGANKVLAMLKALTGWAVEAGRITARPFKLDKLKVSLEPKGILWPEDVQPFLEQADSARKGLEDYCPHSATFLRMMIGLGLREGEALNAEWRRIDWRRRVFIVARAHASKAKVKDRAIREIPIPEWLLHHLLQLWNHQGKPSKGFLLVQPNGHPHGEGATGKAVERCAAALEIQGLTPHRLRATFATGHYEVGTHLTQIAQMMGHEDPAITFKHYIVERPKDQAEAQERLAQAMGFRSTLSP